MHISEGRAHGCGAVWPTDGPEHTCSRHDMHTEPHGCLCGETVERGKAYPPAALPGTDKEPENV